MAAVLLPLVAALLLLPSPTLSSAAPIGVVYRHPTAPHRHPSPSRVAAALRSAAVSHALLPSPSPALLRAFLYSDVRLLLSLPASAAASPTAARRFLSLSVLPFLPRARILALAVAAGDTESSLSAVKHLRAAATDLGMPHLHITAVIPFSAISPPLPPSAAILRTGITPLLRFLNSTGSPVLFDIFPYQLYTSDFGIPVGFALFDSDITNFREDPGTGLRYQNLFDEMLDSAISAVGKAGYGGMSVAVAGTGWPSEGAAEATVEYARRYNEGLMGHLRKGEGTPLRREGAAAVYVRELFDDETRGEEWERHLGIWYAGNLSSKYEVMIGGRSSGARRRGVGGVWWWVVVVVVVVLI